MSRWFPERVVLRLGGAEPPTVASESSPQRPGPQHALAAFERQLKERAMPSGTRLHCVVAAPWVRYRIVPWNPQAGGAVRRQLFAEHCFREAHGDDARGWTVRAAPPRYGQPTLACAIDSALLDGLAELARNRALVLYGVQPALMHDFNAARRHIDGDSYWIVVPEPAALTLLLVLRGCARLVKVVAATLDGLGRVLDREWFALGLGPTACPVYVVGQGVAEVPVATGWGVQALAAARAVT